MGPTQSEQHHHQPPPDVSTYNQRKFPLQETCSETGKYRAQFFEQLFESTVDAPPPRNPGNNTSVTFDPRINFSVSSSNGASLRAMRSGAYRYATFQGWPHSFLSPRILADAGFFYLGTADLVECAFCSITMCKWELNDDPMTEHRRHAPNCPFFLGLPVGNIALPPRSAGSNSATVREDDAQVRPASPATSVLSSTVSQSSWTYLGRSGNDVRGIRQEMRPNALPQTLPKKNSVFFRGNILVLMA
jgi:hypothetical protein